MTIERKSLSAELKRLDEKGQGIAVLATLGIVDRDGDVVEPGALAGQTAPMLQSHDWAAPPWGKGRVREDGSEVLFDFEINLGTARGREMREVLRFDLAHPPAKQQWSWGFTIPPNGAEMGDFAGQRVRRLKAVVLHEVSTVVVGASVGTRTVGVKQDAQDQAALAAMHERVRRMALAPDLAVSVGTTLARGQKLLLDLRAKETLRQPLRPGEAPYKYVHFPPSDWRWGYVREQGRLACGELGIAMPVVKFYRACRAGEAPDFPLARKLAGVTWPDGTIGLDAFLGPVEFVHTLGHELKHVQQGAHPDEAEAERFGMLLAAPLKEALRAVAVSAGG